MSNWLDNDRMPWAIATVLGMLAGLIAKQSVFITSSGRLPGPLSLMADIMVLGVVFIITMYIHAVLPAIAVEGIAGIAAGLAMWGPRGIAKAAEALRRKGGQMAGLDLQDHEYSSIEPSHPATSQGLYITHQLQGAEDENDYAKKSPLRKLRDELPIQDELSEDLAKPLAQLGGAFKSKGKDKKEY